MKILHITPHLGGGVGSVLLRYLKDNDHKISCLDYANHRATKQLGSRLVGLDKIEWADIVVIHFWNHPLLYDFLVREELPPCRIAMWSHVSGLHQPNIFTEKLLSYPDLFILSTPISLAVAPGRRIIWSTNGPEFVAPKYHEGFNVGYIGTVDYSKLHPMFLKMCLEISSKIPEAYFTVCGDSERMRLGRIEFKGWVDNVYDYLARMDIFGYPLQPNHYGTCDQALAEAMMCGVIPVVFDNPMELTMVEHMETGIVVDSEGDYVSAVVELYSNETLRNRLSRNAMNYAEETFSLDRFKKAWENVFEELISIPKTIRQWPITSSDVFMESIGHNFDPKFHKVPTKGTINHYRMFFNDVNSY